MHPFVLAVASTTMALLSLRIAIGLFMAKEGLLKLTIAMSLLFVIIAIANWIKVFT